LRTLLILGLTSALSASCGAASLSARGTVTPGLSMSLPPLPAVIVPADDRPRHVSLRRQHRLPLPADD